MFARESSRKGNKLPVSAYNHKQRLWLICLPEAKKRVFILDLPQDKRTGSFVLPERIESGITYFGSLALRHNWKKGFSTIL